MLNIFLHLLIIITFIFFVLLLVIFVFQWIIYFRVEKTMLKQIAHKQERNSR